MLKTKEDFDRHLKQTVENALADMTSYNLYMDLIGMYRNGVASELKFLAEMPYVQGRAWVDRTFADFMVLHEELPDRYPMVNPLEVIQTMRVCRKRVNQLHKQKLVKEPTLCQSSWITSFGLNRGHWLVKGWTAEHAILAHRISGDEVIYSMFNEEPEDSG